MKKGWRTPFSFKITPRRPTGLVPVSYTHLDVYKRQVTARALAQQTGAPFLTAEDISAEGVAECILRAHQMCIRDSTTPRALLLRILERCAACGTRLVVDECFNEFLDDPAAHTLLGELEGHKNLSLIHI